MGARKIAGVAPYAWKVASLFVEGRGGTWASDLSKFATKRTSYHTFPCAKPSVEQGNLWSGPLLFKEIIKTGVPPRQCARYGDSVAFLQQRRSVSFKVVEKFKEAGRAAKEKIWAAMPKLPSMPKMPQKVEQFIGNVRLSGSLNRALALQFEAFWQSYSKLVLAAIGLSGAYIVWKLTGNLWSTTMRMYVAVTLLAGAYIYFQRRFSIDPEAVYRLGLLKLNTHAGILDVMGAPLAGSDLRSYVLTGGGVRLDGMQVKHTSRRVHMVFPLKGSERRGLVFLEGKKRKGRYHLKVLGVDVPSHGDQEERLYVIGDSSVYSRGGVLASLREPIVKAHLLKSVHEQEDDEDDRKEESDRYRDREAAAAARMERAPKDLDHGGGMHAHERLFWGARDFGQGMKDRLRAWTAPKSASTAGQS
ncbi:hypothetical protein BSKO_00333 [Bryopsis sp. KO-2023]|nr:hypothetical protein BSKO_00333 [Bryopsis sp. KO-2023]